MRDFYLQQVTSRVVFFCFFFKVTMLIKTKILFSFPQTGNNGLLCARPGNKSGGTDGNLQRVYFTVLFILKKGQDFRAQMIKFSTVKHMF